MTDFIFKGKVDKFEEALHEGAACFSATYDVLTTVMPPHEGTWQVLIVSFPEVSHEQEELLLFDKPRTAPDGKSITWRVSLEQEPPDKDRCTIIAQWFTERYMSVEVPLWGLFFEADVEPETEEQVLARLTNPSP